MEHWLFSWFHQPAAVSTPALVREGRGPRGMGWLGTLLGPEGADAVWVCPSGLDRHLAERPRSHFLVLPAGVVTGVRGGLGAGTARTLRTA